MKRNRPQDSNRRALPVPGKLIDLPALVVSALTIFSATLFTALLLTRPEPTEPGEPLWGNPRSVEAPPPAGVPRVAAPPPELDPKFEPKSDPIVSPTLRAELEQLGVSCAEGADCYP